MALPTKYYGWLDDNGKYCVSRFPAGLPYRPTNRYDTMQAAMTEASERGMLIEWDDSALPPVEDVPVEVQPQQPEVEQPVVVDPIVEQLTELNDKVQVYLDRTAPQAEPAVAEPPQAAQPVEP